MSRQEKARESNAIEFTATPKLLGYLDDLIKQEGFGTTRAEIARNFVWKEVNRLLESNHLKPR
jgi:hypothetical protein